MRRHPGLRRAALMAILLAAALHVRAVDPRLQELLESGRHHLEEFEYAAAVENFDVVIAAHRAGRLDLEASDDRAMLAEAFEGKAVALLGAGDPEGVRATLGEALAVHPGFGPDRQQRSPRLIGIFDEVRDRTIGRLDIETEPPGASVWLDDRPVGESPLHEIPWYAGTVRLRIRLAGHEGLERTLELPAGDGVGVRERLIPNARSVLLRTVPPGATLFVEGQSTATSVGPAAAAEAARLGFEPDRLSREILLEHLSPGRHRIRVERACHEPLETVLEVEVGSGENPPLRPAPLVLEPSVGRIEIRSRPAGAAVRVDGASAGRTPLILPAVCAGRRVLELAGVERGRWAGEIVLAPGEERRLAVDLQPTLLFAGVRGDPDVEEGLVRDLESRLRESLSRVRRYHRLPDPESGFAGAEPTLLFEEHPADLILAAVITGGDATPRLELALHGRGLDGADRFVAPLEQPEPALRWLESLDEPTTTWRPWLGMTAVDRGAAEPPGVLGLHPEGPAELAGVLPGDELLQVNGAPLVGVAALRDAVHGLQGAGSADLSLKIRREGEPLDLVIQVGVTPLVGGRATEGPSDRRLLVDLDYLAAASVSEEERNIARLNRALVLLRQSRPDLALREELEGLRLPERPGISQGTVDYVRGICLEQLGEGFREDAVGAFEAAAAAASATLGDHDGPSVAPLARLHLDALGALSARPDSR